MIQRQVMAVATMLCLISACGDDGDAPDSGVQPSVTSTEPSTPTETSPEPDAMYGSVVELRDAAVAAGLECPNWRQSNKVTAAAESGTCSSSTVLSTYLSERDKREVVANHKQFNDMLDDDDPVLVGPNWIINSPQAAELQQLLGGTVVR